MKLLLIACAVLSVALFANGMPTEDNEDHDLFVDLISESSADRLINDQQITCVIDGVLRVVDNNKDLQWWYDEIEKTVLKNMDKITRCATMTFPPRQDLCLVKLSWDLNKEIKRIKKLVPQDKREAFRKAIVDAALGCFP